MKIKKVILNTFLGLFILLTTSGCASRYGCGNPCDPTIPQCARGYWTASDVANDCACTDPWCHNSYLKCIGSCCCCAAFGNVGGMQY